MIGPRSIEARSDYFPLNSQKINSFIGTWTPRVGGSSLSRVSSEEPRWLITQPSHTHTRAAPYQLSTSPSHQNYASWQNCSNRWYIIWIVGGSTKTVWETRTYLIALLQISNFCPVSRLKSWSTCMFSNLPARSSCSACFRVRFIALRRDLMNSTSTE